MEISSNGSNGSGYIKTNETATRFYIKAPQDDTNSYIASFDLNDNFIVKGDITVNKTMFVEDNSIFTSTVSIFHTFSNEITTLSITATDAYNQSLSCNSGLIDNLVINTQVTIFDADITTCTIQTFDCKDASITSLSANELVVSSTSILNENTTMLSDVYISGNTTIENSLVVNSDITTNSQITMAAMSVFLGQIKFSDIPEYQTNLDATSNGIPLWGLYRTGGIIKIRLDEDKPIITLIKLNDMFNISIEQYDIYIEPGATGVDNLDGAITPKLKSIFSGDTGELLSLPITLSSTDITVNQLITTDPRTYTLTYYLEDNVGNYSTTTRSVEVRDRIRTIIYSSSNIHARAISGGTIGTLTNGNLTNLLQGAWTFTPSAMENVFKFEKDINNDFIFNSKWKFIIKLQLPFAANANTFTLKISFDTKYDEIESHSAPYNVRFGEFQNITSIVETNGNTTVQNLSENAINNVITEMNPGGDGIYLEIEYVYVQSGNKNMIIRFIKISDGTVLYTYTIGDVVYTNNEVPFSIYCGQNIAFLKGVLFNAVHPNRIADYNDYKTRLDI